MTFGEWLEKNPPPSMEKLIQQHGSYVNIPDDEWRAFYVAVNQWRDRLKRRELDQ